MKTKKTNDMALVDYIFIGKVRAFRNAGGVRLESCWSVSSRVLSLPKGVASGDRQRESLGHTPSSPSYTV